MKQSTVKTGILHRRRYAITFFLFTVLYHVLVVNRLQLWKVSEISYTYHIVDYKSLGFRAQLLPGAVFYGLFGERASVWTASVFDTVLILLFFAGAALFLEKFILGVEEPRRPAALILLLFYLSGPYTFAIFTDELGMLDVYWLYFSLIFFFILDKKALRFLIPVLFILSLLIHFSSVISYLILFSVLLLYKISVENKKSQKICYCLILACSITATAGLFLYFLFHQSEGIPFTEDEFHLMLQDRGGSYFEYYNYSFFNKYYNEYVVPPDLFSISSPFFKGINFVFEKALFTIRLHNKALMPQLLRIVFMVLILSPILHFLYKRVIGFYRHTANNKLKQFCIFLVMVQFPFTAVIGCLFSVDITRWCTHAFLIFFTMVLYLCHHEESLKCGILAEIEEAKRSFPALVYAAAYFLAHLWAYC